MSKARDLANAGTALTTVSATELGYLDGVTSAVQTQIDSKLATATASSTYEPVLPSQTGNSGKYLTTDGTNKSWGTVTIPPSVNVYGYKFTSGAGAGPYTVTDTFNTGTWTQSGTVACKTTIGSNSGSNAITSPIYAASNAASASIDLASGAKYTSPIGPGLSYTPQGQIAYNGSNLFIAGLDTGYIATSSNGINWSTRGTQVASANGGAAFRGFAFGSGGFVGVTGSNYGEVFRTTDGNNWSTVLQPGNGQGFIDIAWSGSRFVVLQRSGVNLTSYWSTNGTSWNGSYTIANTQSADAIAFGNNTFVTFGNGTTKAAYTSSDGQTWTQRTTPFSAGYNVSHLVYGDKFVAIANNGSSYYSSTSTDGITWTSQVLLSTTGSYYARQGLTANTSATYKYIFPLNQQGDLIMSTNGVDWVTRGNVNLIVLNVSASEIQVLQFIGGKYIAIGQVSSTRYLTSSTDPAGTLASDAYVTLTGPSTTTTTVV